jgi:hypothetical protein
VIKCSNKKSIFLGNEKIVGIAPVGLAALTGNFEI